jgi:gamma-glutamyltranspeptidase/glutathione hydrolase
MCNETGIIFNNEMDDFSYPGILNYFGLVPSEPNFARSGKAPISSSIQVIVTKDDSQDGIPLTVLVAGGAGGTKIVTSLIQIVSNVLVHGMTVLQALSLPRFHHQLIPNRIDLEKTWPNVDEMKLSLEQKGHNVTVIETRWPSSIQAIKVDMKNRSHPFEAVGEPRQKSSGGVSFCDNQGGFRSTYRMTLNTTQETQALLDKQAQQQKRILEKRHDQKRKSDPGERRLGR